MRKILYNYVPYLLISPFYDVELRRIPNTKSALKNLTIMELSYSDEGTLYSFTAEKDTIIVNDIWFDYLYMNQTIINGASQLGPGGALWAGKAGRGRDLGIRQNDRFA